MFLQLVVAVNIPWIHSAMQTESKNLRRVKMRQTWQLVGEQEDNPSQHRNYQRKTWWRKNSCWLVKSGTPSRSLWTKILSNLSPQQLRFPPNPNLKGPCRHPHLNNLHLITLWILSNRCLNHRWQRPLAVDRNLWCLISIHRTISLSSPSLSPSKMLGHSWDNPRCNSSNNNSNSHFNNPNLLLNWTPLLLRLTLSNSKCNSSSISNKISWWTLMMWMRCRGGRQLGYLLTPRINWSNSNNNSMPSSSNSNLWIFIRHQTNNSLRWILGSDNPLAFSNSLLSCLLQATSSRCSLDRVLNSPLTASGMRQIKWDNLTMSSNNSHKWGPIWFNSQIIWWDSSSQCNSNPLSKCKEAYCLSSSKCWTLWIIWNGLRQQWRLSRPQSLRPLSTITKPWI